MGVHPGHDSFRLFAAVPGDPVHPAACLPFYPGDDLLRSDPLGTIEDRRQEVLIAGDLPLRHGEIVERGMGKDPDAAEGEEYGFLQLFRTFHGFVERPGVLSGPPQEEIVRDVDPRPAGAFVGGENLRRTERFPVPLQLGIAERFRPELGVGQPGLGKGTIKAIGCARWGEKGPPGDRQPLATKGLGYGETVVLVGIERGIGDEEVPGTQFLQFPGLAGDVIGGDEPQPPAFDMGIGAIEAAKRAAPLGLQVQDPPPVQGRSGAARRPDRCAA